MKILGAMSRVGSRAFVGAEVTRLKLNECQRLLTSSPTISPPATRRSSAFTMVEIAISLAVIGIALVAIIGVLPLGMNVQRDNREATVINQDATVFIEAIRDGAQGLNDLTNYVYAITNYWTEYKSGPCRAAIVVRTVTIFRVHKAPERHRCHFFR